MNVFVIELVIFILLVIAAFAYTQWRRRERVRRQQSIPHGFVRTPEINVDPTTGVRQQVWFNPTTGDRFYETLDR